MMKTKPAEASGRRAAPPSMTGWDTKAPKRRRTRGDAEVELAKRGEANRRRWAERHPEAARAERAFRKQRAESLKRWDHKHHGTPETHEHASRRNQGALSQLCKNGTIDHHQLAAAVQIAETAERIGADVAVRTASLETRVDSMGRREAEFFERLGQVRREVAYTRWRAEIGPGSLRPVMEMIAGDGSGEAIGFTIVARRHRMHNRRAKRLLIEALDLWIRLLGQVYKEVDAATVMAAQAGIL